MARKIAFYETEQKAIEAVNQLEQAGFVPGDMQIIAKNGEHSRQIEAETDVHVDELQELVDTSSQHSESIGGIAGVPVSPVLIAGFGGAYWDNGIRNPDVMPSAFIYNNEDYKRALKSFGLDNKEVQACLDAISGGMVAVIVETNESKSLLDKDGGPDLSRLGTAEGVFRSSGAVSIISGK